MIAKQRFEAQLQQIFRMLLENKTNEQIASELKISVRTVQNYKRRLEQRYGNYQREKTDNTLFLECSLFKNRLLKMYRILEQKALDPKTSGMEAAKICEVAANIATDVLRLDAECIKAIKNGLVSIASAATATTANKNPIKDLRNDDDDGLDNNSHYNNNNNHHLEENREENNNRKF